MSRIKSHITRKTTKAHDRITPSVSNTLSSGVSRLGTAVQQLVSTVSKKTTSSVNLGGKRKQTRKQTRKRRKSLTITHMKLGKRTPQKKTLRKR